jgi:hypothetical protein
MCASQEKGFRSQRLSLRQHGTVSLLWVVFSPGQAKKRGCPLGDKELNMTGKRKSHGNLCGFA